MSAAARARALLEGYLRGNVPAPGGRLPTIKAMAAVAGIGTTTMWVVVKEYVAAGRLVSRRGRWVELPSQAQSRTGDNARGNLKWQRVAKCIEHDIYREYFSGGTKLPARKELMVRYHVSHKTLRKALDDMIEHGTIVDTGGACYTSPPRSASPHTTLILILATYVHEPTRIVPFTPRFERSFTEIEHVCRRRGINLEVVGYDPSSDRLLLPRTRESLLVRPADHRDIVGIQFWNAGMTPWEHASALLSRLRAAAYPVGVIDEADMLSSPGRFPFPPVRLTIYAPADGVASARDVGRALVEKGHRRIGYVSTLHDNDWSHSRLAGLQSLCNQTKGEAVIIPRVNARSGQIAQATEKTERAIEELTRARDRILSRLAGRGGALHVRRPLSHATEPTIRALPTQMHVPRLCRQLVESDRVTAVVGANDTVALSCLRLLRQEYPERPIAVAGFDNTVEAALEQLSSYEFGIAESVEMAISELLRPRRGRTRDSRPANRIVRLSGRLVHRGSTSVSPS